ncbi:MAG: hypothetical protein HQL24_01320 [Candidatus Omnitrophica bacterium]|nr:hypothetical protein [Candidatus Omnitrophota bacterium]
MAVKNMKFLLILFLTANISILAANFFITNSKEASAQQCLAVDPGINDPGAHFCVIADSSSGGCFRGFTAKTRIQSISIYDESPGVLYMADGFVGVSGTSAQAKDTHGWHCSDDAQDCKANDDDWFMIAEYLCCK